jgi:hypothetical protein
MSAVSYQVEHICVSVFLVCREIFLWWWILLNISSISIHIITGLVFFELLVWYTWNPILCTPLLVLCYYHLLFFLSFSLPWHITSFLFLWTLMFPVELSWDFHMANIFTYLKSFLGFYLLTESCLCHPIPYYKLNLEFLTHLNLAHFWSICSFLYISEFLLCLLSILCSSIPTPSTPLTNKNWTPRGQEILLILFVDVSQVLK